MMYMTKFFTAPKKQVWKHKMIMSFMDVAILNTYLWNCFYTEAPKDKLVDFQIAFFDGEQDVILYGKCHYVGGKIELVKIG